MPVAAQCFRVEVKWLHPGGLLLTRDSEFRTFQDGRHPDPGTSRANALRRKIQTPENSPVTFGLAVLDDSQLWRLIDTAAAVLRDPICSISYQCLGGLIPVPLSDTIFYRR
jgi:hypothetical protein